MAFSRGFKSQCERRSVEFRKKLGIAENGPLPAGRLANLMVVKVWSVHDVTGVDKKNLAILADENDQSWSALTMRVGPHHLIVYKPVSSVGRRNNVIMHELAHIILGHELSTACILEDGSLVPGNFNQDQEDEADWFAGALLLPRPALLAIRYQELSDAVACRKFLVSQEMLKWRFRMTGVDYQLKRRRG